MTLKTPEEIATDLCHQLGLNGSAQDVRVSIIRQVIEDARKESAREQAEKDAEIAEEHGSAGSVLRTAGQHVARAIRQAAKELK